MKRFLALLLILVMVLGVVSGCAKTEDDPVDVVTDEKDDEKVEDEGKEEVVEVAQELSTVYSGEITTLNYLVTTTTSEFSLAANMVDTLIDYDKYGVIQPADRKSVV